MVCFQRAIEHQSIEVALGAGARCARGLQPGADPLRAESSRIVLVVRFVAVTGRVGNLNRHLHSPEATRHGGSDVDERAWRHSAARPIRVRPPARQLQAGASTTWPRASARCAPSSASSRLELAGGRCIRVAITRDSVAALGLAPGLEVVALVKAASCRAVPWRCGGPGAMAATRRGGGHVAQASGGEIGADGLGRDRHRLEAVGSHQDLKLARSAARRVARASAAGHCEGAPRRWRLLGR